MARTLAQENDFQGTLNHSKMHILRTRAPGPVGILEAVKWAKYVAPMPTAVAKHVTITVARMLLGYSHKQHIMNQQNKSKLRSKFTRMTSNGGIHLHGGKFLRRSLIIRAPEKKVCASSISSDRAPAPAPAAAPSPLLLRTLDFRLDDGA